VPISVHWSGDLIAIVSGCGCGVAAARPAIGDGHPPELRRGQQQPLARFGSRQLQIIPAVLD
jgi:hypothetical protein